MPMQPPRFRASGARVRTAWQPSGSVFGDKRKRGRAGQRERAQVLLEEPFCRACLEQGLEVRANEVDHIVPLSEGGSDERHNKQALCEPCHRIKSSIERVAAQRRRAQL